ncbi:hypothetical protein VI817_006312 [Penicillium citrinum]|nr:hypothetical protein VI817_006312 [Penicillium citrinum]
MTFSPIPTTNHRLPLERNSFKMPAAPPTYTTGDPPPSYEEVVQKFEGLIGSSTNPVEVYEKASKGLTKTDLKILVDNYKDHFPLKTEQDKAEFARGTAKVSSAPELQESLTLSAQAASQTAGDVRARFDGLQTKLEVLDNRWGTGWADRFVDLQYDFQDAVDDSQEAATETYNMARKFDNQATLDANNEDKSIEDRGKKMREIVATADALKEKNDGITGRVTGVSAGLKTFIDDFLVWAKGKEGELTARIREIKEALFQLEQDIAGLELEIEAINQTQEGMMPLFGGFAACPPPYGPLIAIGALLFSALSSASVTALMIEIGQKKIEMNALNHEKEGLEKDLEDIREAREGVENMKEANLNSFKGAIASMTRTPMAATKDAEGILAWLDKGAPQDICLWATTCGSMDVV